MNVAVRSNTSLNLTRYVGASRLIARRLALRSGDAARRPNSPAAGARGSGRAARPEPAATLDSRCTTCGCSAPAGEPRGRYASL